MTRRTNIYNRYIKYSSQGVWAKPSLNKYQLELGSNADRPTWIQAQLDRLVTLTPKKKKNRWRTKVLVWWCLWALKWSCRARSSARVRLVQAEYGFKFEPTQLESTLNSWQNKLTMAKDLRRKTKAQSYKYITKIKTRWEIQKTSPLQH